MEKYNENTEKIPKISRLTIFVSFLLISIFGLTSCELIGDIFEAGVWTGIIMVAIVIILLVYIFVRFRKR